MAFVVVHAAVWTLVPTIANHNLPLDVVEALAWGHEWQWGYAKHPPLSAWLAELAWSPRAAWGLYLLSQIMVGGAFWATWRLARDVLEPWPATLSVIAMAAVHYHGFSAVEFNSNVVQFPLWALASLAFWRAVRGSHLGWWLVLGIAASLGVLGKHSFLLLPGAMGVFLLLHPDGRRTLSTLGPYLAAAAFVIVLLPHALWTVANGFPGLAYAAARSAAEAPPDLGGRLLGTLDFLAAQLLAVGPLVVALCLLGRPCPRPGRPGRDAWLLVTLGAGPLASMVVLGVAGVGLRDMWAAPVFTTAGPMLMLALRPADLSQARFHVRRFAWGLGAWLSFGLALALAAGLAGPALTGRFERAHFPGQELARAIEERWREATDAPLAIVVGDEWVAGNAAAYARKRPSVYLRADAALAPWLDDAAVRQQGAMVVWTADKRGTQPSRLELSPLADLRERFPGLVEEPPLALRARWLGGAATVYVNWALVPPERLTDGLPDRSRRQGKVDR
ncbi:MAG: glycosyltransferase family 39 protein [Pseudomonadota bacterium]